MQGGIHTTDATDRPSIKLIVVGDGAVGKTCLLISYTENMFPETYNPTVFNNSTKDVTIVDPKTGDSTDLKVDLWDTAGQEDFDRIRFLSYPRTDIFLLCFSVVEPTSFDNVKSKWIPEVKFHTKKEQKTPIFILVGLKTDLRDDESTLQKLKANNEEPVTKAAAEAWLQDDSPNGGKPLGISMYLECSALKRNGIQEVFEQALGQFLAEPAEPDFVDPAGGCCTVQ